MGLDATVYCNCFEVGKLKEPSPCPKVTVSLDGSLECQSEDLEVLLAFDHRWLLNQACEHPEGVLLHHRIGNLAHIGLLRSELERDSKSFPVLLGKVLYCGTHSGNYLVLEDIAEIQGELAQIGEVICPVARNQKYLELFRKQMNELVQIALQVAKPISF
jgi:hypothetical protein